MNRKIKVVFLMALAVLLFAMSMETAMAELPTLILRAPVEQSNGQYKFSNASISPTGTITQVIVLDHSVVITDQTSSYTPTMTLPTSVTANGTTYTYSKVDNLSGFGFNVYNITDKATALAFIQNIAYADKEKADNARIYIVDNAAIPNVTVKTHYNPKNEHYYQYHAIDTTVETRINWDEAYRAAQGKSVLNRGGYLAAIDTPDENTFISKFLTSTLGNTDNRIWLGGTRLTKTGTDTNGLSTFRLDSNATGSIPAYTATEWWWRTAPNGPADYKFYTGIRINGTKETGDKDENGDSTHKKHGYTNWTTSNGALSEPNNSQFLTASTGNTIDETCLHLYSAQKYAGWNDLNNTSDSAIGGYLVEFGNGTDNKWTPTTSDPAESTGSTTNGVGGDSIDSHELTLYSNDASAKFESNNSTSLTIRFPYGFGFYHDNTAVDRPKRTGYTFTNWYANRDCTVLSSIPATVTSDQVAYAGWRENTYTVKLNPNGGNWNNNTDAFTKTFQITDSAFNLTGNNAIKAAPTRNGYTFTGWYAAGAATTTITPSTLIKTEHADNTVFTYTAGWKTNTYTISYDLDGGSVATANPDKYTIESDKITLNNPTKIGYTFAGWETDANGTDNTAIVEHKVDSDGKPETKISANSFGNISLKATWTVNEYTVTLNTLGCGAVTNPTYDYGTKDASNSTDFELPTPTPTNDTYVFEGWYTNLGYGTKAETYSTLTASNQTYYAKWSRKFNATIDWDDAGHEDLRPAANAENVANAVSVTLTATPALSTSEQSLLSKALITNNGSMEYTGLPAHQISHDSINDTYTSNLIVYTLAKTGIGDWASKGAYTITLNGQTVKFTYSGDPANTLNITGGITWVDGGNVYNTRPENVSISVAATNGTQANTKSSTTIQPTAGYSFSMPKYGEGVEYTYKVAVPTIAGYTVTPDSGNPNNFTATLNKLEFKVSVIWKDTNGQTVTTPANGAKTTVQMMKYVSDDNNTEVGDPKETEIGTTTDTVFTVTPEWANSNPDTLHSYVLGYTSVDGYTCTESGSNVSRSFTLTFAPITSPLTLDLGYKTNESATENDKLTEAYSYGTALTLPVPTREGYAFLGWYDDDDFSGSPVSGFSADHIFDSGDDLTYHAKWSQIFDITYELFGLGTNDSSNPTKFYKGGPDTLEPATGLSTGLPTADPTQTYRFAGWYTDPTYADGTGVGSIPTDSTSRITLYARWQFDLPVSVEWDDANNQDGLREDVTVNLLVGTTPLSGKSLTLSKSDAKAEKTFDNLEAVIGGQKAIYSLAAVSALEDYEFKKAEGNDYAAKLYHKPYVTTFTASVDWQDNNNVHNLRPKAMYVQLLADGQLLFDPQPLSPENNWTYTWTELHKNIPQRLMRASGYPEITAVVYSSELKSIPDGYRLMSSDRNESGDKQTFVLRCIECYAPVIISPTLEQLFRPREGDSLTLTVKATGAESYQWYWDKRDGNGFQPIPGATNPSYTFYIGDETQFGDFYKCVVSNEYASVESPMFVVADLPNTGDNSTLILWVGLLAAAGVCFYLLRRKTNQ